ncbi:hypothetical protein AB0H47_14680 [Streptomyces globisporus]|uniref:hypothetical protein n=2 Tax=Streptomyces globisporus TaxID=1908 RepID=UPI00346110B5
MTAPPMNVTPGPAFMSDVHAASGLHHSPDGLTTTAQLLLTHTPPRLSHETDETVAAGMRALAFCLHLGPLTEPPRFVGPLLSVDRGMISLDYGNDHWVFRVTPVAPEWRRAVIMQGVDVRLLLTTRPTPLGLSQAETSTYLDECVRDGLARWGTTRLRRRY